MNKIGLVIGALAACSAPAFAEDKLTTIVAAGDTTIVYVFPTSPQTFVPVAGLPSFLVMPGAEVPAVATQVVYTVPGPTTSVGATAATVASLDCTDFVGPVSISGLDRFHLDKDGDGIGCEPEDR
jgi:hypothetical protein